MVEPGIVLDALNGELARHRLQFGPKPSTHSHCAIGGMIGNNSCGASAQAYGKTVDNVRRLEILTYDGQRAWVGPTPPEERARIISGGGRLAAIYAGLDRIATEYLADIRHGYPKIPRRVSGYNLDSLLPENGFDVAKRSSAARHPGHRVAGRTRPRARAAVPVAARPRLRRHLRRRR